MGNITTLPRLSGLAALALTTIAGSALAQEESAPAEPGPAAASDSSATAEADVGASTAVGFGSSADVTTPEPTPTTEPTPTEEAPAEEEEAAVEAVAQEEQTQAPGKDLHNLIHLGAANFPQIPEMGLEGGSLRWTMHGRQWPYMPAANGEARTQVGVSGYVWIDTNHGILMTTNPSISNETRSFQQGRMVLRTTPTYTRADNWFVQGQAELVAGTRQVQSDPTFVDADDVWVRFGQWDNFDVQVGRFQGWEVYHFGMGLDWGTLEREGARTNEPPFPPQIYGVTDVWDRTANSGSVALHYYPFDWLRGEVQGRLGAESGQNERSVRPVVIVDFPWVKFKAGYELRRLEAIKVESDLASESTGFGASLQGVWYPYVEGGISAAMRQRTALNLAGGKDDKGSHATQSVGAFLNIRPIEDLVLGGGAHFTFFEDESIDPKVGGDGNKAEHFQFFGAVQYMLLEQLFAKAIYSPSSALFANRADGTESGVLQFINQSHSFRFRLLYLY